MFYTGNGKILQKVRGHDEDIQGLSWSPSRYRNVILDNNFLQNSGSDKEDNLLSWRNKDNVDITYEEDSLIALSSREKTISIWSSNTGRQLVSLRLPGSGGAKNKSSSDKMTFSTCHWWKQNMLLSSGIHGELLEWNLDRLVKRTADGILRTDGNGPEVQVIHREHARNLYSINSTGNSIQTSGQDRSVVSFNGSKRTLDFNLPTFASWIYAIAHNNVDPTIIAAGAGDGQIRIWKVASKKAMFDVNILWQKLNSAKVTALAWHPDKDNIIAFGTDEGRVGIVDAFSSRGIPTFCDFKHRSTVYNICWAPCVSNGNVESVDSSFVELYADKKFIYSCGDGQVMMHSARQEGKTINIENIIAETNNFSRKSPSRSDIVFQPHYFKYLALGSDDGSIEIFATPKLQILCVLKSFHKLIQSLAWHPLHIGALTAPSAYQLWLATSSNEHDIHVWDLSKILQMKTDSHETPCLNENTIEIDGEKTPLDNQVNSSELKSDVPVFSSPTVILSGHHQRVIHLTWSPHEHGKLLSVSYDCTGQVWDITKREPVSNFSGHTGRLFCGLWSPLDPHIIFTGGEDSTIYGWDIRKQQNKLPSKKGPKKNVLRKSREPKNERAFPEDVLSVLEAKRKEILEKDGNEVNDTVKDINTENIQNDLDVKDRSTNVKRRQRRKTYFPISFQQENMSKSNAFNDCQKLYHLLSDNTSKCDTTQTDVSMIQPHLAFFEDRSKVDELLAMEGDYMEEQGDHDVAAHLSLWSGNLIETIKTASKTGKLTDWLVSAAAGISYNLWKEMCSSYAVQLIKEDDVVKGASYYLMIHQVLEAVEVLKKYHYYRPAIAIAISRLPNDAPVLQEIYKAWAYQATNDGCYELASKCWIASGDYLQASNLLAKRPDPSSLRVASFLAAKSGDQEKSRILATQCATQCIQLKDWSCMEKLVQEVNHPAISQMWEETTHLRNENIAFNNECEKEDNIYENKKIVDMNETGNNSASEKLVNSKNEDNSNLANENLPDSKLTAVDSLVLR